MIVRPTSDLTSWAPSCTQYSGGPRDHLYYEPSQSLYIQIELACTISLTTLGHQSLLMMDKLFVVLACHYPVLDGFD